MFFALVIILDISLASFKSINNFGLSFGRFVSWITSSQYSDSSDSSTAIQILLKKSALDLHLHAAR